MFQSTRDFNNCLDAIRFFFFGLQLHKLYFTCWFVASFFWRPLEPGFIVCYIKADAGRHSIVLATVQIFHWFGCVKRPTTSILYPPCFTVLNSLYLMRITHIFLLLFMWVSAVLSSRMRLLGFALRTLTGSPILVLSIVCVSAWLVAYLSDGITMECILFVRVIGFVTKLLQLWSPGRLSNKSTFTGAVSTCLLPKLQTCAKKWFPVDQVHCGPDLAFFSRCCTAFTAFSWHRFGVVCQNDLSMISSGFLIGVEDKLLNWINQVGICIRVPESHFNTTSSAWVRGVLRSVSQTKNFPFALSR